MEQVRPRRLEHLAQVCEPVRNPEAVAVGGEATVSASQAATRRPKGRGHTPGRARRRGAHSPGWRLDTWLSFVNREAATRVVRPGAGRVLRGG